jgi:methyltransferase (TIGR00027 family)
MTAPATENPVSLTAYWTLAMRYEDALSDTPVAHDTFAHRFMNDEARAVAERFRPLKRPGASLPVRHRLIDDGLAAELERDPHLRVVIIGCGFDSRPFRLDGGRWLEIDEPSVIQYKESHLPAADATKELVRIAVRFADESLEEKLAPFATDDRAAVVLEGIVGYLTDDDTRQLLSTLQRLFGNHILFCDLLTRTFVTRYSRRLVKRIRELGAEFGTSTDSPETLFHELEYRTVDRVSIFRAATELGAKGTPSAWLLRLLPSMRDGYCVWTFEYAREDR